MDKNSKTFIVYVASLNVALGIHPDKVAQIALLLTKEVKILDKYSDFINIFSEKKALVLPERTKFNEPAINLEDSKQPLYGPIYCLSPVELETLKTYIETHLKPDLFNLPTLLQVLPYCMIRSQITISAYVLIIEATTISRSKTSTVKVTI